MITDAFGWSNMIPELLAFWREFLSQGVYPMTNSWTSLVEALSRSGQYSSAYKVVDFYLEETQTLWQKSQVPPRHMPDIKFCRVFVRLIGAKSLSKWMFLSIEKDIPEEFLHLPAPEKPRHTQPLSNAARFREFVRVFQLLKTTYAVEEGRGDKILEQYKTSRPRTIADVRLKKQLREAEKKNHKKRLK